MSNLTKEQKREKFLEKYNEFEIDTDTFEDICMDFMDYFEKTEFEFQNFKVIESKETGKKSINITLKDKNTQKISSMNIVEKGIIYFHNSNKPKTLNKKLLLIKRRIFKEI